MNAQARCGYSSRTVQPERSTANIVALDAIENAVTKAAVTHWQALRRDRKLPARSELSPRELRAILPSVVLIRVIDGGRDYEYRIVGGIFAWAYGVDFQGMRLSQIERVTPAHAGRMRELYEYVRGRAEPLGFQGWVGRDQTDLPFVYYESVVLPFGDDGVTVDHLLVASLHVPKAPK